MKTEAATAVFLKKFTVVHFTLNGGAQFNVTHKAAVYVAMDAVAMDAGLHPIIFSNGNKCVFLI